MTWEKSPITYFWQLCGRKVQ